MRKILNELIRKFSASGWNTLVPYQNRPDRFFLRKRLPSDSALLKSMGMLIDYIEDLSNIKKESTNHDLILKNAIEIKKLDFLPVVPDSYLYVSETVHSRFYYIYQLIISIFKYFMELQDLIYYRNDISQFSDFLKIEQNIVKTLNKIIPFILEPAIEVRCLFISIIPNRKMAKPPTRENMFQILMMKLL